MNTYKTASALEGLFDLAYDDKIRIESFSRTHAHTTENEEYLVTIRVIRKTAGEKEPEETKPAEPITPAAETPSAASGTP